VTYRSRGRNGRDDVGVLPHGGPEELDLIDRPLPEVVVVLYKGARKGAKE
jgi:hypothetical protein